MLSTAVSLPKPGVWLLNWEKVHALGRYTGDCLNEWDWIYGNEINVLLLLRTALWIPMRRRWSQWCWQWGFTRSRLVKLQRGSTTWCHTGRCGPFVFIFPHVEWKPMQALQRWHLRKLRVYFVIIICVCIVRVSSIRFSSLSYLLNTDETMVTHRLSLCQAQAKLINYPSMLQCQEVVDCIAINRHPV